MKNLVVRTHGQEATVADRDRLGPGIVGFDSPKISVVENQVGLHALQRQKGESPKRYQETATRSLYHAHSPFRSEEHTSELQSHSDLVCRLLLEKKKKNNI